MNCPVCKTKINFEIPEKDIYYDCSHCQSSLLFSKGECIIIQAEQINSSGLEQTDNKNPPSNQTSEELGQDENLKTKTHTSSGQENVEASKTSSSSNKDDKSESSQNSNREELEDQTQKQADDLKTQDNLTDQKEDNTLEEEDFYPGEETEVPDLQSESEAPEPSMEEAVNQKESSYHFEEESAPAESKDLQAAADSQEKEVDFSDVAEFAKKQEENTKGLFLYHLTLSEINSQELKEKVLAVLEDSYLNLFQDEEIDLQDAIDKGEIKIPEISPVQAYIIVQSLMGLPLNIHWEQKHIADE